MLPPGDLRNCMVALSEEGDLLARLFAHRFRAGEGLKGHNFGNLFVTALTEITGDFGHAIQLASKILATRGKIYPVTTANATLIARMDDGSLVRGETNITASKLRIAELMIDPPDARALPETVDAIARADLITVGPGSLYTSLVTNLLVQGIPAALSTGTRNTCLHLQPDVAGQREPWIHGCRSHSTDLRSHRRAHLRLRAGEHHALFVRHPGPVRGRKRRAHPGRHRAR